MNKPSRKRIVLVDDEDDLVWSLASALVRALGREVEVRATSDASEALAYVDDAPCDLLITDVRMPRIDGMDLLVRARRRRPGMPALVMTAFSSEDVKQRAMSFGSVTYVEKPFELARFIGLVTEIIARKPSGFSGAMSLEGLPDLVQLFAMSGSTGSLRIARPGQTGLIWFDRGGVVHAEQGEQSGVEAFYEILRWTDGEFSMDRSTEAPARTINMSVMELLMEAARRDDEEVRISSLPPPSRRPEAPAPEPAASTPTQAAEPVQPQTERAAPSAEVKPEAEADEEEAARAAAALAAAKKKKEAMNMGNVKAALNRLAAVDGFVGACIVDADSGLVLGAQSGGGAEINLESAAACSAEVVRAERKAVTALSEGSDIEDIVATMGKFFQLIRIVRAQPSTFIYLVLDRARANQGMARLTMAEVERAAEF